jgi:hypothetical protein
VSRYAALEAAITGSEPEEIAARIAEAEIVFSAPPTILGPQPERLTRQERRNLQDDRERWEEHQQLESASEKRWAKQWERAGGDPVRRPRAIHPNHWGYGRAAVHYPEAAEATLKWIGQFHGGAVARRVALAAFGGGRWDYTDLTARRVIALCAFLLRQSRFRRWRSPTSSVLRVKRGVSSRVTAFEQPCVWGIGTAALCALLAWPYSGEPLSREWLKAEGGLFERCERACVFKRQRVPPSVAGTGEVGPSGHTFNRYWMAHAHNTKPALKRDDEERDPEGVNAEGFEMLDAGPFKVPRGRYRLPFAGILYALRYHAAKPPPD